MFYFSGRKNIKTTCSRRKKILSLILGPKWKQEKLWGKGVKNATLKIIRLSQLFKGIIFELRTPLLKEYSGNLVRCIILGLVSKKKD